MENTVRHLRIAEDIISRLDQGIYRKFLRLKGFGVADPEFISTPKSTGSKDLFKQVAQPSSAVLSLASKHAVPSVLMESVNGLDAFKYYCRIFQALQSLRRQFMDEGAGTCSESFKLTDSDMCTLEDLKTPEALILRRVFSEIDNLRQEIGPRIETLEESLQNANIEIARLRETASDFEHRAEVKSRELEVQKLRNAQIEARCEEKIENSLSETSKKLAEMEIKSSTMESDSVAKIDLLQLKLEKSVERLSAAEKGMQALNEKNLQYEKRLGSLVEENRSLKRDLEIAVADGKTLLKEKLENAVRKWRSATRIKMKDLQSDLEEKHRETVLRLNAIVSTRDKEISLLSKKALTLQNRLAEKQRTLSRLTLERKEDDNQYGEFRNRWESVREDAPSSTDELVGRMMNEIDEPSSAPSPHVDIRRSRRPKVKGATNEPQPRKLRVG